MRIGGRAIKGRVTRRQGSAGGTAAPRSMVLRVAHVQDDPFAIARLECVLHDHAAIQAGIALWMKGHCRIRHIFIEGDRGGSDIERVEIETRPTL